MKDQIINHISDLKGWDILEFVPFKDGVKKVFAKRKIGCEQVLSVFFIKDENLIGSNQMEMFDGNTN